MAFLPGYKHSAETKRKISFNNARYWKGRTRSKDTRLKVSIAQKGRRASEETKRKLSEAHKGRKNGFFGKKHTPETLAKISGANASGWRGGVTPIYKKIRKSDEYKKWRTKVFERDNYGCIECGMRNGNGKTVILQADHIKPFALFPELRFELSNGRTLCVPCHKKTGTWGGGSHIKYNQKQHVILA